MIIYKWIIVKLFIKDTINKESIDTIVGMGRGIKENKFTEKWKAVTGFTLGRRG